MIQVVEGDGDQRFHVRVTGANNETLVTGEQLTTDTGALNQIIAVAAQFGVESPNIYQEGSYYALRNGLTGQVIPINLVDERENKDA